MDEKKRIVDYLYRAGVISLFVFCYLMLGKKSLKMAPPNIQKFDPEDTVKLVGIIAASDMTRASHQNENPTGTY